MVSMLALSVVDCGFESLAGQNKNNKIGTCCFSLSGQSKDNKIGTLLFRLAGSIKEKKHRLVGSESGHV